MTTTAAQLVSTRSDLAAVLAEARRAGEQVALVPTMGALHDGHASLMRLAREQVGAAGKVVVTVFVNPLQFGAGEDLDRYPRTLEADLQVAGGASADVVFAPSVDEVYPGGFTEATVAAMTTVVPGTVADILEGASRPGHFRGVLTVVAKLLGLVRPDVAVFGQKDYQQLALIKRMADDLCLGIEIVGAETRRDDDGLALSSRNRYLSPAERTSALALSRSLRAAQAATAYGVDAARQAALAVLDEEPGVALDYLALRAADLGDLPAEPTPGTEGRILIAARVGATRLIDNLPLQF
ncbi:pantoate--beta-alanine ligase [Nocardioides sp.]|uniref:pantoate--beta-alanine ligase n=1 Tax=Nocardioides sp. TaxID=35761 RepID=UPI0026111565|nr:pantoate--beta-alanine ligase [Nocardioides sp.]